MTIKLSSLTSCSGRTAALWDSGTSTYIDLEPGQASRPCGSASHSCSEALLLLYCGATAVLLLPSCCCCCIRITPGCSPQVYFPRKRKGAHMKTHTVVVVGVGVVAAVAACVEQFKVLLRTSELSSLKSYSGLTSRAV